MGAFLALTLLAAVVLANLRLALILAAAVLFALAVIGWHTVQDSIAGAGVPAVSVEPDGPPAAGIEPGAG